MLRILRKGRTYLRRHVNKILCLISRPTSWHIWLGQERGLYLSSDNPNPTGLCALYFAAWWFNKANGLGIRFRLTDSPVETFAWTISIPWVVAFRGSVDINNWDSLAKWTGDSITRCYGFRADLQGFGVRWHWPENLNPQHFDQQGFQYDFDWKQIHGKVKIETRVVEERTFMAVQPASHGFSAYHFEMTATVSRTIRSWPRFWKIPLIAECVDIRTNDPPPVARGGGHPLTEPERLYAICARDTLSVELAVEEYISTVSSLRDLYT